MKRLVLEPFYYARDGVNAKLPRAGTMIRIPDDMLPKHVQRFVDEGNIEGDPTPTKVKGRRK